MHGNRVTFFFFGGFRDFLQAFCQQVYLQTEVFYATLMWSTFEIRLSTPNFALLPVILDIADVIVCLSLTFIYTKLLDIRFTSRFKYVRPYKYRYMSTLIIYLLFRCLFKNTQYVTHRYFYPVFAREQTKFYLKLLIKKYLFILVVYINKKCKYTPPMSSVIEGKI